MITDQDISEFREGVKTVYKQFSDGGVLSMRLSSNTTILESFGFKQGLVDIDAKVLIDIKSIQDFTLTDDTVESTDLYKKMKPMLIALYYKSE